MRFVILSDRRSGSHLLQSALDEHPDVSCRRELLLPRKSRGRRDARAYVEGVLFSGPERAVGFILHREHWRSRFQRAVWKILTSDDSLRVIDLRRRDLLRRLVSERVLRLWKYAGERHPMVHVDYADAMADFRQIEDTRMLASAMFERCPTFSVEYESDLLENWAAAIRSVQTFLEVDPLPLLPTTTRSRHQHLPTVVRNYQELAGKLVDTKWRDFVIASGGPE